MASSALQIIQASAAEMPRMFPLFFIFLSLSKCTNNIEKTDNPVEPLNPSVRSRFLWGRKTCDISAPNVPQRDPRTLARLFEQVGRFRIMGMV